MAQLAFGDRIPLWGVSIHLEEHCGKWKVIILLNGRVTALTPNITGPAYFARGMAQGQDQQGVNLYKVGQATGNPRISRRISECVAFPRTPARVLTFHLDWGYERLDGSTEQSEREQYLHVCSPFPDLPSHPRYAHDR